jgi:hypothetical protein
MHLYSMCQILVFNAINTIVTDMELNIRIDRLPLGRGTDRGQSVYPDIALHISNYYMHICCFCLALYCKVVPPFSGYILYDIYCFCTIYSQKKVTLPYNTMQNKNSRYRTIYSQKKVSVPYNTMQNKNSRNRTIYSQKKVSVPYNTMLNKNSRYRTIYSQKKVSVPYNTMLSKNSRYRTIYS